MGSTCTPTPPGCDYGDVCGGPSPGVAEACINFCVPVFEGEVLGDVPCPLDECDETAWTIPGVVRCPSPTAAGASFACVPSERSPDPARVGFCRAEQGLLDPCEVPGGPNECETGTFCVDAEACGRRFGVAPESAGYCWLPAREGERCDSNLGRGPEGCLPCEAGTWCRVTDDYGAICVRACETADAPGDPRPDLCACDGEPEPCVAIPAPPNEPSLYCRARVVPNGHRCDPQAGPPCADLASDCQPTSDPLRGPAFGCCRYDGDECESDTDCCGGRSLCHDGVCTACGGDGEAPTASGCCPGHVVVDDERGEDVCRSCAVSREGRARALFEGASCEGDFVQLESVTDARETIAVPLDGNTGAGPAELPATSGGVRRVRYALRPEHRLFLLQGDLTAEWTNREPPSDPPDFLPSATAGWPPAGSTVDHIFAQLPVNVPGIRVREVDLGGLSNPASTWQSVRVYDAGACSVFASHSNVTDLIVASLNQYLVELSFDVAGTDYGATPLTVAPEYTGAVLPHITPILSSGTGDFGRAIDSDQLNFFVEYAALGTGGSALGCENGLIRLSAGVRIVRRPVFLPTLEGEIEDRALTREHDCVDGTLGAPCREQCFLDGDRYECFALSALGEPTLYATRRPPRRVRIVRDAFDFVPEVVFFDGGVVDCSASGLNDLLTGVLEGRIRSQLSHVIGQATGNLERNLQEWGVAYEDLPLCGRLDPETGDTFPSDAMCGDALPRYFGGRRHGCVGFDADRRGTDNPAAVVEYRCARVRHEVRRINVRPDGVEIVLADSTADPQYDLLSNDPRTGRDSLRSTCLASRPGTVGAADPVVPAAIARGDSQLLGPLNNFLFRRITHPDDALRFRARDGALVGQRGVCSDRGTLCGGPAIEPLRGGPLRCYVQPRETIQPNGTGRGAGECCLPEEFCPVPAAGGGRPYFDTPPVPPLPPSTTWRCTNPLDDRWACGGCGNVCTPNARCCGGSCLDVMSDPANCGGCGSTCPAETACLDGACCPAGHLACGTGAGGSGPPVCTDVRSNPNACGDCRTRCSTGHCSNGVCCLPGQAGCDGACVDVQSDPANCGGCGVSCEADAVCTEGLCCRRGDVVCDGACTTVARDPANCGACGNVCPAGLACVGGRCACFGIGCP